MPYIQIKKLYIIHKILKVWHKLGLRKATIKQMHEINGTIK